MNSPIKLNGSKIPLKKFKSDCKISCKKDNSDLTKNSNEEKKRKQSEENQDLNKSEYETMASSCFETPV